MAIPQHHVQQTSQSQQQQQQQQQQTGTLLRNIWPADSQIFIAPDPQFHPFNVAGLAPGPVPAVENGFDLQWNNFESKKKKLKEQELLENSQISSVDFLQARSVSTGLGLSLDDKRVASSSSGSQLMSLLDEDVHLEIQRQDEEMDRFVRSQGERMRQAVLKKMQSYQLQTLACFEERVLQKLREKESEVVDINKKNVELEERMKHLNAEAGVWQHRAKCNENMITVLKFNLQQVFAQSQGSKEGCGDSEVDDTASCCNGGPNMDFGVLINKENKNIKELMTCKVCRTNEVCMLLLPCRHLCLCKDCESKLSFCPLCQSSKFIGMEIYM